jgi:hypothetical protein
MFVDLFIITFININLLFLLSIYPVCLSVVKRIKPSNLPTKKMKLVLSKYLKGYNSSSDPNIFNGIFSNQSMIAPCIYPRTDC